VKSANNFSATPDSFTLERKAIDREYQPIQTSHYLCQPGSNGPRGGRLFHRREHLTGYVTGSRLVGGT
jgi:hypothetical protein